MYLVQHSALSAKKSSAFTNFLPSISQLEMAADKLLLTGVLFLTSSILSWFYPLVPRLKQCLFSKTLCNNCSLVTLPRSLATSSYTPNFCP